MQCDGEGRARDQSWTISLSNNRALLKQKIALQEDKIEEGLRGLNMLRGYLHKWKSYFSD